MAKAKKKPAGFGKFKSLLRTVVSVPKEAVEKRIAASKRNRRK